MLIQYTVENYKSIRDEIIINFRADKKRLDSEWVAEKYRNKLDLLLMKNIKKLPAVLNLFFIVRE